MAPCFEDGPPNLPVVAASVNNGTWGSQFGKRLVVFPVRLLALFAAAAAAARVFFYVTFTGTYTMFNQLESHFC